MNDCFSCATATGEEKAPGGLIVETEHWLVDHCTGPLGVGTLIVKPKRHVLRVGDLTTAEAAELGTLLQRTAAVVDALTRADQTYICLWSHSSAQPVHIHYVVQPVTRRQVDAFGARGPALQAAMFARGEPPDPSAAAAFAARARDAFVS